MILFSGAALLTVLASGPTLAAGGAGGSGSAGTGGVGGVDNATAAAAAGGASSRAATGTVSGGGGAGGGAGVVGGAGGRGAASPLGLGGAGGSTPGANGGLGQNGGTAGAGGGGGGAHGFVGPSLPIAALGGKGGNGGASTGGGGGGGAGGYGAVVTGDLQTGVVSGAVTGGQGGAGGNGGSVGHKGSGGSGGFGIRFLGTMNDVTIEGAAAGGSGGGMGVGPRGVAGNGGVGVDLGTGNALTVDGTVRGGNGGAVGLGSPAGTPGLGGIGIQAADARIVITADGSVAGGVSGNGIQANAITFTGGTNSLELRGPAAIDGAVQGGAGVDALILGGTAAGATFDVSLLGPGAQFRGFDVFAKTGAGSWMLTGVTTESTPWTVSAGPLVIAAEAALGAVSSGLTLAGGTLKTIGDIAMTRDITLETGGGAFAPTAATTLVLSGVVGGAGGLTLDGDGLLTLAAANTYTGATLVNRGVLVVDGSIVASSGVTVAAGATLGGSGLLPSLRVDGTVAPGNSPGTLTVNGNLVMGPGSLYLAEVQGPLADRIDVTGSAALAGTLRLAPLGGPYRFDAPYTVLSAAAGLGGTRFAIVDTVGSFGAGVSPRIVYGGTDVWLTLAPAALAPMVDPRASGGRSVNAFAVASGIDSAVAKGADPSLLFAIFNLPAAAIPAAVNQLSGEVHTAAPAMAGVAAGQFLRAMLDGSQSGRLSGGLGHVGVTGSLPRQVAGPRLADIDPLRVSLWGAAFGSTGRSDGDRVIGSSSRTVSDGHAAIGADLRLGFETVIGVAASGGRSRAALPGGIGKAEADVLQAGLHGRTRLGAVDLAAALAYGRLDTDTNRAIPALARTGIATSYVTQAWSGRIEASLPFQAWSGVTLSPLAAIQAVRVTSPAAIERDGFGSSSGLLTLAKRSGLTSRSELGLRLDARFMAGATPVSGFVRGAWARYSDRDGEIEASINGLPGARFKAAGVRPDRDAVLLAAGLDIRLAPSISLGARVDTELSQTSRRVGGGAHLRISF